MNTSNNTIQGFLKAKFEALKGWLVRYSKIVLPIILVLCVALTIVIAVRANKRKVEQEETAIAPEEGVAADAMQEVPEVPLEKDAVPEVNELFNTYYDAMVEGDTGTMGELLYYMDATEILKAAETSKYLESHSPLEVYTKAGPKEGTYIAYVYVELKFFDYDRAVPGMRTYYVCTNDEGKLYINEDGEESENELHYMREVNLQDDVVDLSNKAAVAYNNMVKEDKALASFLATLMEEIDKNVGEALARTEDNEEEEGEEAEETPAEEDTASDVVVTKVKTTDVVNIRTSDSETADKLGKAAVGDEFKLLETKGNGWSKIEYEGSEAYIKSDYLEPSETQTVEADAGDTDAEAEEEEQQTASAASGGTVTVKENVRIRSGASENSEKLATAYTGDKLEVIMKQADGWTKIKYNGKTAYVKSEFVE